jgi:hypothetical protein
MRTVILPTGKLYYFCLFMTYKRYFLRFCWINVLSPPEYEKMVFGVWGVCLQVCYLLEPKQLDVLYMCLVFKNLRVSAEEM